MTNVHIPYLLARNEAAFLGANPIDLADRTSEFLEDSQGNQSTGLAPADIVLNPSMSIPMPNASKAHKRWYGVNPSMLRLPQFWLPEGFAEPDDDEPEFIWAARAFTALQDAKLWETDKGFVDVLVSVGIDADSDADIERIRRWQAGADDADLDSIDLSVLFASEADDTESVQSLLLPVSAYLHAAYLGEAIEQAKLTDAKAVLAIALTAAALQTLGWYDERSSWSLTSLVTQSRQPDSAEGVLAELAAECQRIEAATHEVGAEFISTFLEP